MRTATDSQGGFTLLELVISITILVVMVIAVSSSLSSGRGLWESSMTPLQAERLVNRTVLTIAEALRYAEEDTVLEELFPPEGSSRITFQSATADGLGPVTVLEWVSEPGDPEDGLDNDDDGLIDEGMIMRTLDQGGASERKDILVRGVARLLEGEVDNNLDDNGNGLTDERGFSLGMGNRALHVRLTLVRSAPGGGQVVRSAETSVALRD
jgi:hypothetical protein